MNQDERWMLIEVSVLYYLENYTQSEIAKKLFISRSKVSRLLKKAREEDVVDIKIDFSCDQTMRLRSIAMNYFDVADIVIVKTLSHYEDTVKELGKAASNILYDSIHEDAIIGVSWGSSVQSTVKYLKEKEIDSVKVVELFGAFANNLSDNDMLSIGSTLAKKVKGQFFRLSAPLYIDDDKTRNAIVKMPMIQNTLKMIDKCDFILSGLGAIDSEIPQYIWDEYLDSGVKNRIVEAGGVGFLCAHFFDKDGQFLNIDINEDVIGIPVDRIKQKKIICVAGGINKMNAIRSALKGGYIHTLVIDDQTLEAIIDQEKLNPVVKR